VTATPRTSRRPRHAPEESEREILIAAEAALRERPFREVTVDEVMNRTGLKRPSFYVHFRDRHDMALRVVQNIGAELMAMTERWLKGEDPSSDARAALEGITAVYLEHGPVLRAIADAATQDEGVESAYRGLVQAFIDATAGHIEEEQAAGRIDPELDGDATAEALIWLNERYLSEKLGRRPQSDPQQVIDTLYEIWMRTLYRE
jgi:AcrR family transcriptional regulator